MKPFRVDSWNTYTHTHTRTLVNKLCDLYPVEGYKRVIKVLYDFYYMVGKGSSWYKTHNYSMRNPRVLWQYTGNSPSCLLPVYCIKHSVSCYIYYYMCRQRSYILWCGYLDKELYTVVWLPWQGVIYCGVVTLTRSPLKNLEAITETSRTSLPIATPIRGRGCTIYKLYISCNKLMHSYTHNLA